jgi:glycosyltransferase involved in cell wall biosynthesis
MPTLTALLHTKNDALRLGRVLETLYPCDHILIVDHNSHDGTVRVAREFGARVVRARAGASPYHYLQSAQPGWIFCLDPRESLTESLAATLYEWKTQPLPSAAAFSVFLREETPEGWIQIPAPQTRLVPAQWTRWRETFPASDPSAPALEGELLRFAFP